MKLRVVVCALAVACLLCVSVSADDSKSAGKQAQAVNKNSQQAAAAAKAGNLNKAKQQSGVGFDTPAKSTGTVQGKTGAKPSVVGVKASEFHPAPKTSKPLDKTNVPAPPVTNKK
jgi:hypothetical protein